MDNSEKMSLCLKKRTFKMKYRTKERKKTKEEIK